jgi:HEPN domain-containing protein
MPSAVREWVAKADADFRSAQRLLRARKEPDFDGAFFHAQQCIEKLMKAALIRKKKVPPKTHDLIVLHDLLSQASKGWTADEESLRFLTRGAVGFRYPGASASRDEAKRAVSMARVLREALLGLV